MHFKKNILSIVCRRDGAEMAGEDVGRPKGECNSEEPPSPTAPPHAAGVWWAQILPFQHADAATSGHTEGHLPRLRWWQGSW